MDRHIIIRNASLGALSNFFKILSKVDYVMLVKQE